MPRRSKYAFLRPSPIPPNFAKFRLNLELKKLRPRTPFATTAFASPTGFRFANGFTFYALRHAPALIQSSSNSMCLQCFAGPYVVDRSFARITI
jgi:hypothetical protein